MQKYKQTKLEQTTSYFMNLIFFFLIFDLSASILSTVSET